MSRAALTLNAVPRDRRARACVRHPHRTRSDSGRGDCPFGAGLSCFAPSPGGAGSRPFGLRSLSRARPAGLSPLPRPPGGAVAAGARMSAWTRCAMARMGSGGDGPSSRPEEDGHRPLPTSEAFARGGGIVVPDELPGKHHALDAAAVGEHGAEDVGRAQGGRALAVPPEPDHAVADGGRGDAAPGGERLEAGRGHRVRSTPRPRCCAARRPGALTCMEPSRSPLRTQLIHSQPAPSPPIAGGGGPLGSGSGVPACGCGASGRSATASSAGAAGAADRVGPRSERQADPALRLLGDRAKLARAVAEVGGEGAERGGLLADPAEPGLAGEPGEEQGPYRGRGAGRLGALGHIVGERAPAGRRPHVPHRGEALGGPRTRRARSS